MNSAQRTTVEYFLANAKETGSVVEIVDDEFGVMIIERYDDDGENMQNQWTLRADGTAHLH